MYIYFYEEFPDDLLLYALLTVVVNIVSIVLMWFYVPRYVGKIVIDKKIVKRTIRPLLRLFLPQIANSKFVHISSKNFSRFSLIN